MAKTKTFEESYNRIREILAALQNGELPLEESLKLFEEGVKLVHTCEKTLDGATQRVLQLVSQEGEEPQLEVRA